MTGRDRPAGPPRRAVRGALLVLAAAGVVGGAVVLAAVPPTADSYYPRCHFHSLTGLHCPGCGTTRSLHAALNGRPIQALRFNALALVVLPVVGWSLVHSLRDWVLDRPSRSLGRRANRWVWVLVGVVAIFGIVRNLPWYPFTLLAPTEL